MADTPEFSIEPMGDAALRLQFGRAATADDTNAASSTDPAGSPDPADAVLFARAACERIRAAALPQVRDVLAAHATVLVCYDPLRSGYEEAVQAVAPLLQGLAPDEARGRLVTIPVAYGGDFGPDLAALAEAKGLSEEEVVGRHAAAEYTVASIGFMPGFAYLDGLDPLLATPRLASPRTCVPAGSVGIAACQSGIYPLQSPGGWNLVGRTPVRVFDPRREPAVPYRPGDRIRFVPIDGDEFARISAAVAAGTFDYDGMVTA